MVAALKLAVSGKRTQWQQWVDDQTKETPAKSPQKPPARKKPAAKRDSGQHQLLTADDLRAAIAWCLDGIPADNIDILADRLRPLANDFRTDRPEVAATLADMSFPGVRRGAWGIACSILARDADARGDVGLFWSTGFEVIAALRNGRIGQTTRSPITQAILEVKAAHPNVAPGDALDQMVKSGIAEYLPMIDAVTIAGKTIQRESFNKQFRRV